MKPVRFLGDSLKCLRAFPKNAKQDAGRQIDKIQRGGQPDDFKPMPTIGRGAEELRVWDDSGTFRVIYTARLPDAVYVLHAFQKKTQTTSKRDLELARMRFSRLIQDEP
ncbi:type II toxin-antitoxin system RelE/ParE family toxin [Candidatus Thiosymbion oneisti]|uniref:type II toxin-antitoxin system RelE/ParE family toxin n=1 Tax=Candidatus Thiosymbion oneisti TaxID=589554 RepID=UPI000B7ED5E0|nr:type II toxin-antitoxin system RelE/ParE family toxin [Candidatus Thiosymbion oneisti]